MNGLWIIDLVLNLYLLLLNVKYLEGSKTKHHLQLKIKEYSKVTYLGCVLDKTKSGEPMALKVISKINSKLKFLHKKYKFFTSALRRLSCIAFNQLQFDYASSVWYPNLTQKMKNKIQITQNKRFPYYLQLQKITHILKNELETLNWLPGKDIFNQSINSVVSQYLPNQCRSFLNEI